MNVWDNIKKAVREISLLMNPVMPSDIMRECMKEFEEEWCNMTDKKDLVNYEDVIEKEKMADSTTMDIKYLIDDLIDSTGVIQDLRISLPRSCLKDVCKVLEKREFEDMNVQMSVYSSYITLEFSTTFKRNIWDVDPVTEQHS